MSSMQRWKSQERRMDFFRHFTILLCAPAFNSEDLEGLRLTQITAEIEKLGFKVVRARRVEDAEMAVQTDAAIGCMVVDWGKKGLEGKTAALINLMRRRGLDFPIILLVRHKRFEDLPLFLLTPGVEASKAGTLISGLIAFKKLHDDNAPLEDVCPEFFRRWRTRYAGVRLRDLCAALHRFFRDAGVSA